MNNYTVYRHTSPSSKVYIGITYQKPERRWSNGNGYKDSPKFYNAIQKYGWNNFKHEILYSGLNEISAKMIEEDLIYYYKSLNISYNISAGGDGSRGVIMSEETRLKMSNAKKGKHLSEETKEKLSKSRIGKSSGTRSEETRKKMSEAAKNRKPVSEETKKKISEAKKGHIPWNKGIKFKNNKNDAN